MVSPAVPGLFFCFAATALLIIASVSAPVWEKVSFLDVTVIDQTIHFGVFGYTGSTTRVGYTFDPAILGFRNNTLNNKIIHTLTFALILHPIAAGLAAIATVFGLCGAAYSRGGTIFMTFAAALATLVTLVAWIIDMILWTIARNRIRAASDARTDAQYGNAVWLTLGALLALLFGFCASSIGACGRYRRRPSEKF